MITAHHTHYCVPNYNLGDNPKLEEMLSLWDDVYYKRIPLGYTYNEKYKCLLLPRGLNTFFVENKLQDSIYVDTTCNPFEKIFFKLKCEPRDNRQRLNIAFLIGDGDFKSNIEKSQLALTADTGEGKTYSLIAALSFLQMKSIIITPNQRIKQQWFDSFDKFTSLGEDDVVEISSSKFIEKMMSGSKNPHKIFICNFNVIVAFAKKHSWNALNDAFIAMGIGLKVYDEAHLWMAKVLMIDMYTNVKKTIYLTATFDRSNPKEKTIFDLVYNTVPKFNSRSKIKATKKQMVLITIKFNSKPDFDDLTKCKTKKGFNLNWYSDYIKNKQIYYDVILYALNLLKSKGGKVMLLSTKIDTVDEVSSFVKNSFDDKKTIALHSKTPEELKQKLEEMDIICSTPKTAGTGFDLYGLRSLAMTEPYSSEITANQITGRLRYNEDFDYTFYVEFIDTGFKEISRMHKKHLKTLEKKSVKHISLTFK